MKALQEKYPDGQRFVQLRVFDREGDVVTVEGVVRGKVAEEAVGTIILNMISRDR